LTYAPSSDFCNSAPATAPDTFTYTLDGGSTATVTVTVTCENDAPTVASGGTLAYTENDPATALDPTLTVADIDSPIAGATVAMTTNHEGDEDVLALLGSHPGIVATVKPRGRHPDPQRHGKPRRV